MHEFSLGPIVIVLLVSVITVICCRKFNIPSMLGYLWSVLLPVRVCSN